MTNESTDAEPDRLTEQPRRLSRCPECGANATDESIRRHTLSAMGYLHDDQTFECSACGHGYTHGVPVGEYDGEAASLWCNVCNLGFMRVHRSEKQADGVRLHLKCAHHHPFECPECDCRIDADGVTVTKRGEHTCPHCDRALARADVPYCAYFDYAHRSEDDAGRSLVGYPDTTGAMADAEPYGYAADEGHNSSDSGGE